MKELSLNSCKVRNGGPFLKSRVSEIRVNQIRVNQGLGVITNKKNFTNFQNLEGHA